MIAEVDCRKGPANGPIDGTQVALFTRSFEPYLGSGGDDPSTEEKTP